jgi:hypothetical protein
MCGFENEKTRKIGVITIISMVVLMIGVVIYTVVSSAYLQPSGTKVSLNVLAILEYFLIIINAIMCIIGFLGFYLFSKGLIIYYTIVQCIVFIITLGITVTFVANGIQGEQSNRLSQYSICYNTTKANNTASSNTSVNNTNNYTFVVDYYITKADQLFCSTDCPCGFTGLNNVPNRTLITKNSGPTTFKNCPENVISNAEIYSKNFGFSESFDELTLTLNWLETKFNCVGFCATNYSDSTGLTVSLDRYLFSNVNSGKPEIKGCLQALISWIIKFCLVVGILDILILIPGLLLIIEGYMFWFNFKDPEPDQNNYGIIIPTQIQGQMANSEGGKQRYVPRFSDDAPPENVKNVEMYNKTTDNNKQQKREENYLDKS